jgi:hypothetical protein
MEDHAEFYESALILSMASRGLHFQPSCTCPKGAAGLHDGDKMKIKHFKGSNLKVRSEANRQEDRPHTALICAIVSRKRFESTSRDLSSYAETAPAQNHARV